MTIAQGDPDTGQIRVPPRPNCVVMEDRTLGTKWLLQWSDTAHTILTYPFNFTAKTRFSITDVIPLNVALRSYGPYEGPYLGRDNDGKLLRLFIKSQRLCYETVENLGHTRGQSQARVFARILLNRKIVEVILPTGWAQAPDRIAWNDSTI